jgi:hypothetical protein
MRKRKRTVYRQSAKTRSVRKNTRLGNPHAGKFKKNPFSTFPPSRFLPKVGPKWKVVHNAECTREHVYFRGINFGLKGTVSRDFLIRFMMLIN